MKINGINASQSFNGLRIDSTVQPFSKKAILCNKSIGEAAKKWDIVANQEQILSKTHNLGGRESVVLSLEILDTAKNKAVQTANKIKGLISFYAVGTKDSIDDDMAAFISKIDQNAISKAIEDKKYIESMRERFSKIG